MDYQSIVQKIEDNEHLISMISVDEILRFGYEVGLCENSNVLDLCCGYGTILKVWSQAFRISGIGVDITNSFLKIGIERLKQAGVDDKIRLICDDVLKYADTQKYDVVICSETISSIQNTFALGEKFLKKGGILTYHKVFSKVPNPPKELVDFDGELLSLAELNCIFNELGYYLICMASDTDAMWERYVINWSGRRDIDKLRQDPDDEDTKLWIDKWYKMYFDYRRPYEGQALFGLQKL